MNIKSINIICGKRLWASCRVAVLWLAVPFAANATVDIREGQWKTVIGIAIENPDMRFAMPSVKFLTSSCLTQKEPVPNIAQKNQKCETTNYQMTGSTAIWTSRCVDKDSTIEGSGEIVYKTSNYEAVMHMTRTFSDPSMPPVKMIYTLSGNHDGECKR